MTRLTEHQAVSAKRPFEILEPVFFFTQGQHGHITLDWCSVLQRENLVGDEIGLSADAHLLTRFEQGLPWIGARA